VNARVRALARRCLEKESCVKKKRDIGEGGASWLSLLGAFREAVEWALEVAVALAWDYPEEVDAVDRVRTFLRGRLEGKEVTVDVEDVLFTFGLLISAIERDLPSLRRVRETRCPGADFPDPKVLRRLMGHGLWTGGRAPNHAMA
jgi:hypothetical protein